MPDGRFAEDRTVLLAGLTSGTVIAHHIAGKATRDALYLSTFPVTTLPRMVIAAAAASIVAILLTSRAMRRIGPGRLVPGAFAVSGILFLGEWGLAAVSRPVTAVLVYLHLGALGALLISGFWSLVSERFDPRSAKHHIGRIAAGGTVGGVVGGVLAERMAAVSTLEWMLPLLALLHLAAGALTFRLRSRGVAREEAPAPTPEDGTSALEVLTQTSYLRNLALLVLLGTMGEGLLDYVFKAEATEALGGGDALLRLFALFYTGISVLTFLLSTLGTRAALERLGLARTVASYPGVTLLGSFGAFLLPGLPAAAAARGSEAIVSNSLYRSGTEVLFTPVPRAEKRATKSFIDVGAVRMGDILAAGVVQVILALGVVGVHRTLLAGAMILSVAGLVLASRLHRGYVEALQRSLMARGGSLGPEETSRFTQTALMQTMGAMGLTDLGLELSAIREELAESDAGVEVPEGLAVPVDPEVEEGRTPAVQEDPVVRRIRDLRSGDAERVRKVLRRPGALGDETLGHAIPLLAWDEVMPDVTRALKGVAERHVGQILDALLDHDQIFAVRRRIPGVLGDLANPRVFNGLAMGLEDPRFEVRYRCGRALARIRRVDPGLRMSRTQAQGLILREVDVDRRIWESRRILDRLEEDTAADAPLDTLVRERANRGLEHVCHLLALYLPPEPVRVAFRGLHTDDPYLRGTALEYLETVLEPEVWEKLWPFLQQTGRRPGPEDRRDRDALARELLRSNASILANLEALLAEEGDERGPEGDT